MPSPISSPPLHPDMKRELKQQLLAMSARSFEFFAGEFLVYVGLEAVSVTRYIGDGGIDALGDLIAGQFRRRGKQLICSLNKTSFLSTR